MVERIVTATITNLQGVPVDQSPLTFIPEVNGHHPVLTTTDATGDIRVGLETGVPYALGIMGGVQIDGNPLSAVAVIRLTVPDGEESASLLDCATHTLSTEWPVLLRRLEALEQWREAQEDS